MKEIISKSESKSIIKRYKNDAQCCLIELNGKKLKTKALYFDTLKEKLQLNDSFSNNLDAYSDMMRDEFTYYNKKKIVFVIKHYQHFLEADNARETILKIFDNDIIPYFETKSSLSEEYHQARIIHIYCVL